MSKFSKEERHRMFKRLLVVVVALFGVSLSLPARVKELIKPTAFT